MAGLRGLVRTMLAALLAFGSLSIASAQDTPDQAPVADENLLDADTLDGLVAPIALYPDALLTQILVASTFPLDVVKAEHFVEDNADTADAARADLAAEEPWDESVRVLAGGFPQLIDRMADEIEWTETLGDAMLLQTDDLLDAVQRQRARAVATGYLDSNEAQTVDVEDDTVSIAPADPEVVYVPSYDPAQAFTSAPTAAPVVYGQDSGFSVGNTLATGAIAFGGAMSFMVGENGVVYEADLGEATLEVAGAITAFDPGDGWAPIDAE